MFCCCRKFAYVDLASEMDLTKVLKCNGEMLDGKPMEIARARAVTKETVKASVEDQKGNSAEYNSFITHLSSMFFFLY